MLCGETGYHTKTDFFCSTPTFINKKSKQNSYFKWLCSQGNTSLPSVQGTLFVDCRLVLCGVVYTNTIFSSWRCSQKQHHHHNNNTEASESYFRKHFRKPFYISIQFSLFPIWHISFAHQKIRDILGCWCKFSASHVSHKGNMKSY